VQPTNTEISRMKRRLTSRARSVLFTNPPLSADQVLKEFQGRETIAEAPDLELRSSLIVPGSDASVEQTPVPGAAVLSSDGEAVQTDSVDVQVVFKPAHLGVRAYSPSVEGELLDPPDLLVVKREEQRLLKRLSGKAEDATPEQLEELERAISSGIKAIPPQTTEPYIPAHLPLRPVPVPLPRELEVPRFYDPPGQSLSDDIFRATTVFAPEDRQILWDTSYPWGTNGRVTTGNGWGSGVLVGPRHLLTCSHVIVWNADGSCGWVDFTPGYFDRPPGPFGSASAIRWYAYRKVTGPDLDVDEGRHDYCVLVLNWRIGEVAGWMGSKSYADSWDGYPWWSHVGYPSDFGGHRPTWQNGIAMDGDPGEADSNQRMYHFGDVIPGQSGGAFFGWWPEGPHAIAVQSGHTPALNLASGGSYISNLINQALSDFP
jgi:V8-like Glu-specific endopeptidase